MQQGLGLEESQKLCCEPGMSTFTEPVVKHKAAAWYAGYGGQMLSLVMFVLLGVACYMLARKGAAWELAEGGGGGEGEHDDGGGGGDKEESG
jgi:hypothetical protein